MAVRTRPDRRFSSIYTSNARPHTATVQVALKEDHTIGSYEYIARTRRAMARELPQLSAFFQSGGTVDAVLNQGLPAPIDVQLSGSNIEAVFDAATELAASIRALPRASDVFVPQDIDYPSLRLDIDRERAATLGLDQREVVNNVITALTSNQMIVPSHWVDPKSGRFAECFTAAVQTRIRIATHPAVVPLSGGHDPRHILLAMNELRRLPDCCVTVHPYPPAASEVVLAKTVADALRVGHVVLPERRDRVAAEREKHALTHFCTDEHVQFLPLRDYFSRHPAEVFDGLAGDVLSQSQRLDRSLHRAFVEGQFDRVAEHVLGDATVIEPALARLLTGGAASRFNRRLAARRVADEAVRHAGAPNPIAAFFFLTRMRREIALAPYALLDVCPVSTPFLDGQVVDLLLSLPFELVADRTFHTETLRVRYPQAAHIPFDSKRGGADDRAAVRRDAAAFLRLVGASQSALLNRAAVAARTARAIATGVSAHLWFIPRLAHLIAVEHPPAAASPFPTAGLATSTATV
jgi:AcrB/AcrD/AcrF family